MKPRLTHGPSGSVERLRVFARKIVSVPKQELDEKLAEHIRSRHSKKQQRRRRDTR